MPFPTESQVERRVEPSRSYPSKCAVKVRTNGPTIAIAMASPHRCPVADNHGLRTITITEVNRGTTITNIGHMDTCLSFIRVNVPSHGHIKLQPEVRLMNLGTLFRVGTRTFSMVQDPNIHLLARGAWGGAKRLQRLVRKSPTKNAESEAMAGIKSPMDSRDDGMRSTEMKASNQGRRVHQSGGLSAKRHTEPAKGRRVSAEQSRHARKPNHPRG